MKNKNQIEIFLARTKPENDCQIWQGGVSKNNYPQAKIERRTTLVHNYIYRNFNEQEIPEGMLVIASCGNKKCLAPQHLVLKNRKEHILTTDSVWAINARKTHCPKGHEYTEDNTFIMSSGARACIQCGKTGVKRLKLVAETDFCVNNHKLTLDNTYLNKNILICKECEYEKVNIFKNKHPFSNLKTELGYINSDQQYFLISRLSFNDSECWNWDGNINDNGYGVWQVDGKNHRIHRIFYNLYNGEISENLVLDHLCRNRLCCNPKHLEAVSIGENVLRGEGIAANNKLKNMCKYGHLYTEDNLYRYNTARVCKICTKERDRKRYKEGKIINVKVEDCPQGHKYEEGTYKLDKLGRRKCLICIKNTIKNKIALLTEKL